jgi:hypothetical protein
MKTDNHLTKTIEMKEAVLKSEQKLAQAESAAGKFKSALKQAKNHLKQSKVNYKEAKAAAKLARREHVALAKAFKKASKKAGQIDKKTAKSKPATGPHKHEARLHVGGKTGTAAAAHAES